MIRTDDLVKMPNTTNYFNRVILTEDEFRCLYQLGHASPSWLQLVVINLSELAWIMMEERPQRIAAFDILVDKWSEDIDTVMADLILFSEGKIDRLDLSIKYGIFHKKCRSLFEAVLGDDVDVAGFWKQHKKHKQQETTITKYGVTHSAFHPDVKAKRVATNIERYGVENPMSNLDVQEEFRKNLLETHGVEYAFMLDGAAQRWRELLFDTLVSDPRWCDVLVHFVGDDELSSDVFIDTLPVIRRDFIVSDLKNANVENLLSAWVTIHGQPLMYPENSLFKMNFTFSSSWLQHYSNLGLVEAPAEYLNANSSLIERDMEYFLRSLGVIPTINNRSLLSGLEIDFYLPDLKVGIEISPNTTHNSNCYAIGSRRVMYDSIKCKTYHYDKYKLSTNVGIHLIQLFDYDLKEPIYSTVTKPKLKALILGYRDLNVDALNIHPSTNMSRSKRFLEKYDRFGSVGSTDRWDVTIDDDLIGVVSFTPSDHNEVTMQKICLLPDVNISDIIPLAIGAYIKANPQIDTVFCTSDNSESSGEEYVSIGATLIKDLHGVERFVSHSNGSDSYSWEVSSPRSGSSGTVYRDAISKGLTPPQSRDDILKYVETELSHRLDDNKGYDRIFTAGSKLWVFKHNKT